MRCKVRLESITRTVNGATLNFAPVTSGSKENEAFFKWTPFGKIELGVVNNEVVDKLTLGGSYYVDFTEAV